MKPFNVVTSVEGVSIPGAGDVLRTRAEGKSSARGPEGLQRLSERWRGISGRRHVDLEGYDQTYHWSDNRPACSVGRELFGPAVSLSGFRHGIPGSL